MTIMTCARCKFFTRQNLPAGAVDGEGLCLGYLESLQELVAWDREQCGIYRPARPMKPREDWIAARQAQIAGQGEDGNAAGNDPEGAPRRADDQGATSAHLWRK